MNAQAWSAASMIVGLVVVALLAVVVLRTMSRR
jgi:hypothetical protein